MLKRSLNIGTSVSVGGSGWKLEVKFTADKAISRLIATFIGQPSDQQAKPRLRNQETFDRARQRGRLSADQRISVFVNSVSEIMVQSAIGCTRSNGFLTSRAGVQIM